MNTWLDPKAITTAVIVGLLGVLGVLCRDRLRAYRDGKVVVQWLRANTRDEPGESHRTISEISRSLGLTEDRVNKAIAKASDIHRSKANVHEVSVWRDEPQSVYERRGPRFV